MCTKIDYSQACLFLDGMGASVYRLVPSAMASPEYQLPDHDDQGNILIAGQVQIATLFLRHTDIINCD